MRSIGICPYITLYSAIVNIDNGYFLFPFLQIESVKIRLTRQYCRVTLILALMTLVESQSMSSLRVSTQLFGHNVHMTGFHENIVLQC